MCDASSKGIISLRSSISIFTSSRTVKEPPYKGLNRLGRGYILYFLSFVRETMSYLKTLGVDEDAAFTRS
jgi:hypothetical protein